MQGEGALFSSGPPVLQPCARIIHKAPHYGAIYEGTKVFVKFESGVRDKNTRKSGEEQLSGGLDIH